MERITGIVRKPLTKDGSNWHFELEVPMAGSEPPKRVFCYATPTQLSDASMMLLVILGSTITVDGHNTGSAYTLSYFKVTGLYQPQPHHIMGVCNSPAL